MIVTGSSVIQMPLTECPSLTYRASQAIFVHNAWHKLMALLWIQNTIHEPLLLRSKVFHDNIFSLQLNYFSHSFRKFLFMLYEASMFSCSFWYRTWSTYVTLSVSPVQILWSLQSVVSPRSCRLISFILLSTVSFHSLLSLMT